MGHYGHSAEPNGEDAPRGCMRLLDMGAEYHGYTADVTCSYPASGEFSVAQKRVYSAVWSAVLAVEKQLKPGVRYGDMHRLAQRTILTQLKGFLFKEDACVDAMMKAEVCGLIMPHGLGHMLGLAVHDVGGYVPGESRKNYDISENLRCNRVLEESMVITVEPGCYFVPHCLNKLCDPAGETAKFLCVDKGRLFHLAQEVGGIRIEDDVVITRNGCRVLNNVPREIEEIEEVCRGDYEWDLDTIIPREYSNS